MALVSVLLVGISTVFRVTSDTIGAGAALGEVLRGHRSIGNQLSLDFLGYSSKNNIAESDDNSGIIPIGTPEEGGNRQPAIVIFSSQIPSFFDAAAESAATNVNRRADSISFFTNGSFQRQVGEGSSFTSDFKSNSAWIWYGHLRIFNGVLANANATIGYDVPGTKSPVGSGGVSPNYFARDWVLGRGCYLLSDFNNAAKNAIIDNAGVTQTFINRPWATPETESTQLNPLTYGAGANQGGLNLQQMGTDLAATTADLFRQRLQFLADPEGNSAATAVPYRGGRRDNWYEDMLATSGQRFWCNPYPGASASFTPESLARRVQYLQPGVTQFAVEFAGDFAPLDGQIDTQVVNGVTQIRWYGFPRNVAGLPTTISKLEGDVLPLRDYAAPTPSPGQYVAENSANNLTDWRGPEKNNSSTSILARFSGVQAAYDPLDPKLRDATYTVAFGPYEFDKTWNAVTDPHPLYPRLIRIVVEISDPNGKLKEPVVQEYVFPVKK